MELKKKSDVYIFLDTNVFEQCKSFSEINWSKVITQFKPDIEYRNIILKVPYMVIMELDDHKKFDNKARKTLAKIRKFEKISDNIGLKLEISIRPPRWDRLDSNIREELIENENDHRILAEIFFYKSQNQYHHVLFITGDYVPHKLAAELGINTINWLDEEYKSFFQEVKKEKKPDLELLFINEGNSSSLIEWELKTPQYLAFEDYEEPYEDLKYEDPMRFELLRPDYEVESDIEVYNQEVEEFSRYIEIKFLLINNGNHPYSNIDVFISTHLEQQFKITHKLDVKIPTKPDPFDELYDNQSILYAIEESEVRYHEITKQKKNSNKMDYKWDFGYYIEKVKHNETFFIPFPIMIWIPEKTKQKKITFKIRFTHDESGKIKEQKLEINLN
jgi:hypothetical protein